jgi:predicted ATP-grasp superfamily ATP-dependent carboligase
MWYCQIMYAGNVIFCVKKETPEEAESLARDVVEDLAKRFRSTLYVGGCFKG